MIRRPPSSPLFPSTTLSRSLLAVALREHDVHVGDPAVGDPHFLPVQDVMRAFLVQFRARQRILGIGTGLRLGEAIRSEEHTSELQSRLHLGCRLLLEKKKDAPVDRTRARVYSSDSQISQPAVSLNN